MIETILNLALSVVPRQEARLYRWHGRKTNAVGLDVDVFAAPVPLTGSIQPVDRSRYAFMGLDAARSYIAIYSSTRAEALTRTANPDQVEYLDRRYRIMNAADWQVPANYSGLMAVDIGPATGAEQGGEDVLDGK